MDPLIPSTCIRKTITILKFVGMWLPKEQFQSRSTRLLYRVFSFQIQFWFIYIYTLSEVVQLFCIDDMKGLTDALFLLMTNLALIYKVINYSVQHIRIRDLVTSIDFKAFRPETDQESRYMRTSQKTVQVIFYLIYATSTTTITGWAVSPLIAEGDTYLPIPAWFPFHLDTKWRFAAAYIYLIFGVFTSAIMNLAMDVLTVGLMSLANAYIKILGCRLENLGHFKCHQEKNRKEVFEDLRQCIEFHKQILRLVGEIENIFKGPLFAQMGCTIIIICVTAFQMLMMSSPGSIEFVAQGMYIVVMMLQVFIYCWMGNEITHSSTKLSVQAYCSDFLTFDRRSTMALLFFMQRSSKNITISASGFFEMGLNLRTFLTIIKTSYSNLAVLQSVNQ